MNYKVLVVASKNVVPDTGPALRKLGKGWRITQAHTSLVTHGTYSEATSMAGAALHLYYATTIIVEKLPATK